MGLEMPSSTRTPFKPMVSFSVAIYTENMVMRGCRILRMQSVHTQIPAENVSKVNDPDNPHDV